MPELRKGPVVGRWVIISTDRGKRPSDFGTVEGKKMGGFCPFCPGNEDKTPPEIVAIRSNGTKPNASGWSVRVVPNKYPALQIEGDLGKRCIFCDIIHQELNDQERIVSYDDHFLSMEAYASRFPFETWIIPRQHRFQFGRIDDGEIPQLAAILKDTLRRINLSLNSPPYNLIIHSSPLGESDYSYYHWHIEIMPKLTKIAGFEWGSGFYINPTPPEEAARLMKDLDI